MVDIITVVYAIEIPYLKIQAKSLEKYLQLDVKNIHVIVNDDTHYVNDIDKSWWGKFENCVKIYPYTDFNYTHKVSGWDNQQLCKLLGASKADSEWSIVLDAKTFFIKECQEKTFFENDKACTKSLKCFPNFFPAKLTVENLYSVNLESIIGPGGVPFLFHTKTVNDCINETESLTNQKFTDFFLTYVQTPHFITEFILYSGFVKFKHKEYNQLYQEKQSWRCVNVAEFQINEFDSLFEQMHDSLTLTVSIATKAWKLLTNTQQVKYLEFLKNKDLILDPISIQNYINTVSFD